MREAYADSTYAALQFRIPVYENMPSVPSGKPEANDSLNNYYFSDDEWKRFFTNALANPNEHIVEKTRKIQEDNIQVLTRDDGSSKNITLIDKKNIHNNLRYKKNAR